MILKKCKFCEKEFKTRYLKKEWCNNAKCILDRKRETYEADIRVKICKCGEEYNGTRKSVCCAECAYIAKHTPNNPKEITVVDIICKRCGDFQGKKELLRDINANKIIRSFSLCENCLGKSKINHSENKKGKLNPNFKFDKLIEIRETKEELSQRMKLNNPMFSEKIAEKVSKTFKKKIKNGEIKYKTGKEHHLYKGNRKRSFILRSRLKHWVKKWLIYFDYTCCECKKRGGKLEVHHDTPFRDIVVKYTDKLDEISYEDFEKISKSIIEEHKNIEGIPLCKECHSKIDNFRKLKNG